MSWALPVAFLLVLVPFSMGVVAWVRFNPDALNQSDGAGPVDIPATDEAGPFIATSLFLGFTDVNGDGLVNHDEPNEPVYLDVGGDHYVTHGDIRLTSFARYGPGSAVDFTNPDFDRRLQPVPGWFHTTADGAWFLDVDASQNVTVGDVRVTGLGEGVKMAATQDGLGAPLSPVQTSVPESKRVLWSDTDGDGRRDPGEFMFLDLDGDGILAAAEPRINDSGLSADSAVTQADLDAAIAAMNARDGPLTFRESASTQETAGTVYAWIAFLAILGIVTLVGIVGIGWYAYRIDRRAGRAPFQQDHGLSGPPERPA